MSYEVECGRCGERHRLQGAHVCPADVLAELKTVSSLLREFIDMEKKRTQDWVIRDHIAAPSRDPRLRR